MPYRFEAALLSAFLVLGACALPTPPPRDAQLVVPGTILSFAPTPTRVIVTEADGHIHDGQGPYPFSSEPPTIAAITPSGFLSCLGLGNATVTVRVGALIRSAPVRCRPFDHFSASSASPFDRYLRAYLDESPFVPDVVLALSGSNGGVIDDVTLDFTSETPDVLASEQGRLMPKKVGRAWIVARAGDVAAREFPVDVVRRVGKPWRVRPDGRAGKTVGPGRYELTGWLEGKPLTVDWPGAPACRYSAVAARHVVTCTLLAGGEVVVSPAEFEGILLEIPVTDADEDAHPARLWRGPK